jgi:hypothetical protein
MTTPLLVHPEDEKHPRALGLGARGLEELARLVRALGRSALPLIAAATTSARRPRVA